MWDTCVFYLIIIVLNQTGCFVGAADSAWCCQSFRVIAAMESFNEKGKRCFLTSSELQNTGAVLKQSRNLFCTKVAVLS